MVKTKMLLASVLALTLGTPTTSTTALAKERSGVSPSVHRELAYQVLRCDSRRCYIKSSAQGGGLEPIFLGAARTIKAGMLPRLVINGQCRSACASLAVHARPRVCITRRATFHFHAGWNILLKRRQPPKLPFDILLWISQQGGLSDNGKYLVMNNREARKFFKSCSSR